MDKKYSIALDQALIWVSSNFETTGIIISGSIVRGNPDENSDFDIYVIHDNSFRQRIQKLFNGVPCEIFINNLDHVYKYFESELKSNRPVTANIIATGELFKGKENPKILTLIDDAKKYVSLSLVLTEEELTLRKYMIANLFEDATDIIISDNRTCLYILDKVIAEIIEFVFSSKQQPLPRIKDRLKDLIILEPTIGLLIERYNCELNINQKYELARKIVHQVAGQTSFFEWSSTPE